MEVEVLREERIDKYLAEELGISRSTVKKMIDEGFVLVNGKEVKASLILSEADELFVKDGFIKEASFEAEDIPINIVYEDDDLLVINKKSGMVVHPGNLSNKEAFRPGIVHRIDKDTSGLMLVAKNDKAHDILAEGFKNKTIKREYIALVCGVIGEDSGVIDAPIGRDAKDRKKMCVTSENSKKAVTHFKVLKRYEDYTLLKLILDTGRTHQIRVHMKYIGHPVYNDPVYGKAYNDYGQFLHSASIDFEQPTTHEHLHFECDVPKEFQDFLDTLN